MFWIPMVIGAAVGGAAAYAKGGDTKDVLMGAGMGAGMGALGGVGAGALMGGAGAGAAGGAASTAGTATGGSAAGSLMGSSAGSLAGTAGTTAGSAGYTAGLYPGLSAVASTGSPTAASLLGTASGSALPATYGAASAVPWGEIARGGMAGMQGAASAPPERPQPQAQTQPSQAYGGNRQPSAIKGYPSQVSGDGQSQLLSQILGKRRRSPYYG